MKLIIMFLLMATPELVTARQSNNAEMDTILQRLYFINMNSDTHLPVTDAVAALLASINEDGSWPAFDYTKKPQVDLPAIEHISRLVKMAVAYKDEKSSFYQNESLIKTIHRGLVFWIKAKPESRNWWYNRIGVPNEMAKLLVLMQKELTADEKEAGIAILKRANVNGVLVAGSTRATGQNMIWVAGLQMQAACLESAPAYLHFSVENMSGEMKVSTGEGIQPDWSFHQHGPQLYAGGYGLSYTLDCAQLAYVLHGTAFALNDSEVNNLTNFLLEGQQWMLRGNKIDYGTMGREISRQNKTADKLALACDYLAHVNTARQKELWKLAEDIRNKKANNPGTISGNRYFYRSDFMSQVRLAYYTSVKMASDRIVGSESGNNEGLKNYHLGDGSNLLMKTGKEYENIFPLWDWQRIPGITCCLSDSVLPLIDFGRNAKGTNAFAGGVSNGHYGLAAYCLSKDAVRAQKAWFFFDNEYVCLGTGIDCDIHSPVITAINQCFAKGNTIYSEGGALKQLQAEKVTAQFDWVFHDGTAYILNKKANAVLQVENKTGNWNTINRNIKNVQENGNVFSLWIDHGIQPNKSAYEYAVVPEINLNKLPAYIQRKPYIVISNTEQLQAVEQRELKIVQAAFWQAGKLFFGMYEINVTEHCLVIIQQQKSLLNVSVSNPENKPLKVWVHIKNRRTDKQQKLEFNLPGGEEAGRSITQNIPLP